MEKKTLLEPIVEDRPRRPASWVVTVVISSAILLMAGAAIAGFRPELLGSSTDPVTTTVRVFADYVVARNGALAVLLVLLLAIRAAHGLVIALLLVALIQTTDGVLDIVQGRLEIVPVAAAIAIACIAAAVRHSQKPLWQWSTWQDF